MLQRVCDVFMAFPLIIMALAIVSIFGTGVEMVIIAITIPFIPNCARVVRSSALALKVSLTSTLPGRSDMATLELLCATWSQRHGAVLDNAHGFCWPSNID